MFKKNFLYNNKKYCIIKVTKNTLFILSKKEEVKMDIEMLEKRLKKVLKRDYQ